MWSNFISTKANNIYNSIFIKNEKNAILDPFSCMVRLAVLNFKPKGTKISFYTNKISYNEPCMLQGPIRWSQGDNREDLHNLFQPIKKAMDWYDYNDDKIKTIFLLSEKGVKKLQNSYTYNSLITHSLELYRTYIKKHYEDRRLRERSNEITEENKIFSELKKLWSDTEINIIFNILSEMQSADKKSIIALIKAIESILIHKEEKVQEIIVQNTTLLE
tara:strand:- start:2502 stop:3155 length:654 start_codon:yes stop_codon:yes gene_type:complete